MGLFRFVRYALGFVATLGLLAGCGGLMAPPAQQQLLSPEGSAAQLRHRGLAYTPLALHRSVTSDRRGSWMARGAAKASSLLYVADEAQNTVNVYAYPTGTLQGTLTGFNTPSGICSDKKGNVYIMNGGGSTIDVYAHGGTTPLRTLNLSGYPELNCSVDPETGNLAVGILDGSCGDCIDIFPKAEGYPITITPSGQQGIPGCAYDNKGDLFCDAYGTHDRAFTLSELAKGASSVTTIPVSETGITAGPVQWDGEYLTVGSGALGTLYQLALTSSKGSVAGSTTLNGTGWVWQFWITDTKGTKKKPQGTRVIAPTYAGSDGAETGYWNYPAGGNATQAIPGYAQPDGAALSIGKT